VLVQVHSAAINPVDWKIIMGYLKGMFPFNSSSPEAPATAGLDFAGVIVDVGSDVTEWKVGDAVFAKSTFTPHGATFAEYAAVDQALLARKPTSLSFEEAAAIPLVGLTSYQALFDHGELVKGQKVLVIGGSGGTGIAAIQLAHHAGAHVTTVCSGGNVALVQSLGADVVIDYTKENYADVLDAKSFDLVYACTGGKLADVERVIKDTGIFVNICGTYADGKDTFKPPYKTFFSPSNGEQLKQIASQVEDGKYKVILDQVFPLDEIKEALKKSIAGHAKGKIVIKVI
jgi:NADPH:quinone reductase-like Zn-dependent oxidoreductase